MHGCEYLMKVDASNRGIGCQLFQKQPIPFKPEFVGDLSEADGLKLMQMALDAGIQDIRSTRRADVRPTGEKKVCSIELLTTDSNELRALGMELYKLVKAKIPELDVDPGVLSIQCNYNQKMRVTRGFGYNT